MANFGWKYGECAAAGAADPPTADGGGDQTQAGLTQVTIPGTGSTAGATMAWTLFDPSQTNKTSILSDASLISPTFQPISSSASAGNWVANLAVTKGGLTSYDSVNIRVGDVDGWITLFPDDAQITSASQSAYGTASWGRTGDWTTMTIGDKAVTSIYPKYCESKWYTPGVDFQDLSNIEFMIEADDSYTQPTAANLVYVGMWLTTGSSTTSLPAAIPGWTGQTFMFKLSNRTETTSISLRSDDQNFSFGHNNTGENAVHLLVNKQYYGNDLYQVLYQKIDTVTPADDGNDTDGATYSTTKTFTGTDKVQLVMAIARNQTGTGVTAKFKAKYRLKTRS